MAFWTILNRFPNSDKEETSQKNSGSTSMSSSGTIYNTIRHLVTSVHVALEFDAKPVRNL